MLSPDIVYRGLVVNNQPADIKEIRNNIEVPRVGYSAGIMLKKPLSARMSFETGLLYTDKGYKFKKRSFLMVDPLTQTVVETEVEGCTSYNYIDLPVSLKIQFGKQKIGFIAGAGLSLHYFLNERSIFHITENGVETTNTSHLDYDVEPFNISPTVSAGIAFDLSDKMALAIEPTFKYGLIALTDTPVAEKLYSVGLNTTLYFN
jgi:hypothetical protein